MCRFTQTQDVELENNTWKKLQGYGIHSYSCFAHLGKYQGLSSIGKRLLLHKGCALELVGCGFVRAVCSTVYRVFHRELRRSILEEVYQNFENFVVC